MKTEYRYVYFEYVTPNDGRKTDIWDCRNRKSTDLLGKISWHSPWRQYCFFPLGDTVFSEGCLEDIQDFIGQLMYARQHLSEDAKAIGQKYADIQKLRGAT